MWMVSLFQETTTPCEAGSYSLEGELNCTECEPGFACPYNYVAARIACGNGKKIVYTFRFAFFINNAFPTYFILNFLWCVMIVGMKEAENKISNCFDELWKATNNASIYLFFNYNFAWNLNSERFFQGNIFRGKIHDRCDFCNFHVENIFISF